MIFISTLYFPNSSVVCLKFPKNLIKKFLIQLNKRKPSLHYPYVSSMDNYITTHHFTRLGLRSRYLITFTKVKHSIISRAGGTVCVYLVPIHFAFHSSTLSPNNLTSRTLGTISETFMLKPI